ncbi:MAG: isopentenyl-diphosphate Delta-isomerase [Gammaproteobacteria bacterium]|nr:isopentenyl-diphosphate Delta-isomerase [Gammaproteobacteria bacterium]
MEVEQVVLVDSFDRPIGSMPKHKVHRAQTPLHRGFSLFLFNHQGELLLQQRSASKTTWPLIWSNSCCGHPLPDEHYADAVRRRATYELGIAECSLFEILPDYSYQAIKDGVMENEICPVWVGWSNEAPQLNDSEVNAVRWVAWSDFIAAIMNIKDNTFDDLSIWCLEEATLLHGSEKFRALWKEKMTS